MRTKLNRQVKRGFSLIELLLVLVIIAVLAALVVPQFAGRSEQARITAAKADLSTIGTSLSTFEIDTGRFPNTDEGLDALVEEPASVNNWQGSYLTKGLPKDPWGNEYVYEYPGTHNTNGFDLYSLGPDGQAGTDDDVTNWEAE